MNTISFPDMLRDVELEKAQQRKLNTNRLLVLLLGPSGVGKSTIIERLSARAALPAFEYVKPTITRPNRPSETEKVSVSETEFDSMAQKGEFAAVNRLYGVRYGTPLQGILNPLSRGAIPVLDFPLAAADSIQRPEYDTLSFYVYPSCIDEWRQRMQADGRNCSGRLESGITELGMLAARGFVHTGIDFSVINAGGTSELTAASSIIEAMKQLQPSPAYP